MADPAYIDPATGILLDGDAWVGIATTTLASDTGSVTFTSTNDGQTGDFSQYLDLHLVGYWQFGSDAASHGPLNTWLSGDETYAHYFVQRFYGTGSGSPAAAESTGPANGYGNSNIAANLNMFCTLNVDFFDINSGKYKSALSTLAADRDGAGNVAMNAWVWKSQAPVTSVKADSGAANFLSGSMFSLFGILPRMVS